MGKERITPEQWELRNKLGTLMAEAGIRSVEDIHILFKEMIGSFVENVLEGELEEELGTASTTTGTRTRATAETGTAVSVCVRATAR